MRPKLRNTTLLTARRVKNETESKKSIADALKKCHWALWDSNNMVIEMRLIDFLEKQLHVLHDVEA